LGVGSGSGDLGVRLGETGLGQTLFDNVRVFDNSASNTGVIPEPSTLVLFGVGFLGLMLPAVRKRRNLSLLT
jgi:hypothetical protein